MKQMSVPNGMKAIAERTHGCNGDNLARTRSTDLTPEQMITVKYFFGRMKRVYGRAFTDRVPDESTQRGLMQEFAKDIINIDKKTMDKGFDCLHVELGNVESQYKFMPIDAVIQLVKAGGNVTGVQDGAYKLHVPKKRITMSEELKQKQKQTGDKTLSSLKSLF